jgi:lysophospholipase L1-like esterase
VRGPPVLGIAAAILLTLTACQAGQPAATHRPATGGALTSSVVYVALGASETAGVGTDDASRQAFPQVIFARFGRGAVLYNFGIPAETTEAALNDELPAALAVKPNLATVFFNVDDLAAGVSPADFQSHLDRIVGSLAASGPHVRVLVASAPPVDRLPVFDKCQSGSPSCPLHGVVLPSRTDVQALVVAYNAAIERVVAAHGAILVNLDATGDAIVQHPDYVSPDGLHPSQLGAAALADAFYSALGPAPA